MECDPCYIEAGEEVKMVEHPNGEVFFCPTCGHEAAKPDVEPEITAEPKEEEKMPRGHYDRSKAKKRGVVGTEKPRKAPPTVEAVNLVTVEQFTKALEDLKEGMADLQRLAEALGMEVVLRRKAKGE